MTHNLETKSCFGDLFDKLNPEKKVEIIKPKEVKRNETLDLIVRDYEKGLENYGLYDQGRLKIKIPEGEHWWYYIAKLSSLLEIPSERITEFSLLLEEYENKKDFEYFTGWYLSALINESRDKDFKIFTNCSKTTHNIGYKNTKNIDVNGNAGNWVGGYMEGGEITVNGNVGDWIGNEMKDGKITINGNVGRWVGWGMKDGKITINGNVGDWVGLVMRDGKIYLNGDYKSLSDYIYGGNIYHKGKLIVKNGEKLI